MEHHTVLSLNQLHYRCATPQRKLHLQLLRTLVANQALDGLLLILRQRTIFSRAPTSFSGAKAATPSDS